MSLATRLFVEKVIHLTRRILHYLQLAFLALAAILIFLWTIDPIRNWLEEKRLFNQDKLLAVIAVALAMIIFFLEHLTKAVMDATRKMDALQPSQFSWPIIGGVLGVYPRLREEIDNADSRNEKTLEVLGLTLYTAWPMIKGWLQEEKTRDWKVTVFCLSPAFIKENLNRIPQHWLDNAIQYVTEVRRYIQTQSQFLSKKGIVLSLHEYSFFPAIHGFRIGKTTLFISFSQWSADSNKIDSPMYFYEYFPGDDRSLRALEYKKLFDNWLEQAGHSHSQDDVKEMQ